MKENPIDFTQIFYKQKQEALQLMKDGCLWNKRANFMNKRVKNSIYNDQFIQKMNLKECKSLLDFGCGTGNISLKIASKFSSIYALDYSEKMIKTYENNAQEKNISHIHTSILSDKDEWNIPPCDIVIASRSLQSIVNIKDILQKLNSYARKRVYLTYKTNFSFYDDKLYNFLEKKIPKEPDYILILNILYELGIFANLDFINAETKYQKETTYEQFLDMCQWEMGALNQEEKEKIKIYFENEVKNKPDIFANWAFISWEKEK